MNITEALAKSIKSGNTVRIRTNDSARAIALGLERAGCTIRSEKRIDDTRAGSSLSALLVGGEKDGKSFEIVAAGVRPRRAAGVELLPVGHQKRAQAGAASLLGPAPNGPQCRPLT